MVKTTDYSLFTLKFLSRFLSTKPTHLFNCFSIHFHDICPSPRHEVGINLGQPENKLRYELEYLSDDNVRGTQRIPKRSKSLTYECRGFDAYARDEKLQ